MRTDGREESTNRVSQFLRTGLKTYEGFMKAEFIFTNQEGQATLKTPLFGYINRLELINEVEIIVKC
jgi:hypothetical protein